MDLAAALRGVRRQSGTRSKLSTRFGMGLGGSRPGPGEARQRVELMKPAGAWERVSWRHGTRLMDAVIVDA
ncbi:MAG: hypothetical protein ACREJ3_18010, partial [Polyangiaceae bacterium]